MKWALVLSGGGARGIAHIGVLKALERMGMRPSLIVGTSFGAIIGSIYACGMSVERMEDFMLNEFNIRQQLEGFTFQLGDSAFMRFLQAQEAMGNMASDLGVDSGTKILELLRELTENKCFAETEIPFLCNAVDLVSTDEVVLESGLVADAVRASMAVPGIFHPVRRDGMLLADGGIKNNLPVWIARSRGFHRVIAVDISPFEPVPAENLENGFAIFYRAFGIASNNWVRSRRDIADVTVTVRTGVTEFDFDRKQEVIDRGLAAAVAASKEISRVITSPLAPILSIPRKLRKLFRE